MSGPVLFFGLVGFAVLVLLVEGLVEWADRRPKPASKLPMCSSEWRKEKR